METGESRVENGIKMENDFVVASLLTSTQAKNFSRLAPHYFPFARK
jgi:hypothetical protein